MCVCVCVYPSVIGYLSTYFTGYSTLLIPDIQPSEPWICISSYPGYLSHCTLDIHIIVPRIFIRSYPGYTYLRTPDIYPGYSCLLDPSTPAIDAEIVSKLLEVDNVLRTDQTHFVSDDPGWC